MTFAPRDPNWEAKVRASFARQGVMEHIGARIVELVPGRCSIAVPHRPELTQQHGYFHAGISSTIVDSAGGYAAFSLFEPGTEVLTVEFKINLLAPADGEELIATGEVVRAGRTITVCTGSLEVVKGGVRKRCGLMQQTLIRVEE